MAEVTAALVKELRDKTGAGMMDCKRALAESDGDIEGAIDQLRKKGLAAAAKKAGRIAAEGLVGVATSTAAGAVVEVNSETDFVGRNELFQALVRTIAGLAATGAGTIDALPASPYPGTAHSVADEVAELVSRIGENLVLRRVDRLSVKQGVVASYVHNSVAPGLGKIGVLVALESAAGAEMLSALARQLAMHVASANPQYLDRAAVPTAALDREREVLRGQAETSGKSADIVERMVDGRLGKFYEDNVLLDQIFISPDADGKSRVGQVVAAAAKAAGSEVRVTGFVRFALGEGIEKPASDFAAEVGAQLKH